MFVRRGIKKLFGQEQLGAHEYLYSNIVMLCVDRINHIINMEDKDGKTFSVENVSEIRPASEMSNRITHYEVGGDGSSLKFKDPIDVLEDSDIFVLWIGPTGIFHEYGD